VLTVVYILLIFVTFVAALALVTFSPIRQVRQPARSLLLGLGSSGVTGLSSIPLALFDNQVVWLGLLVIGVLITGIGGVLIGLLGSTERISTKMKDDFAPKHGHDQWYGGWGD
jgi:hypothetical protein